MKSFILTIGTLLISYPLVAQTNFSTPAPATSPVTGAPILDPGNTAPIPPTFNNNPVNSTGVETSGAGAGMGTGMGTGVTVPPATTFDNPPGSQSTPPATRTTQPGNSIMGNGWQGI